MSDEPQGGLGMTNHSGLALAQEWADRKREVDKFTQERNEANELLDAASAGLRETLGAFRKYVDCLVGARAFELVDCSGDVVIVEHRDDGLHAVSRIPCVRVTKP